MDSARSAAAAGSGDSSPTAASERLPRPVAGAVLTRMRATPCSHRSTGLDVCFRVRVKPSAPSMVDTRSVSGVTSSAKVTAVGVTGAGGSVIPAASWSATRERIASAAVRPESACRKTSLKTSSESGP